MSEIVLHDYWRSSASYRVRIALNLLGLAYRAVPVNLQTRDHRTPAHMAVNPQGFVPVIEIDGQTLTQSLAIIEYLDETRNAGFLPKDPLARARARQLSYAIAMDIHPVCNLYVASRVVELTNGGDEVRKGWMQEFITPGLDAVETLAQAQAKTGATDFAFGDKPGLADICIVPQLYNARRWGCDDARWPRLVEIDARCNEMKAFQDAHPDTIGAPPPKG